MLRLTTAPFCMEFTVPKSRATEAYVQQKVSLPATLVARFAMLHFDPVLQKTRYGAISDVLSALLTNYVNSMENGIDPLAEQQESSNLEAL